MSGMYGPADRAESVATIQEALYAGVTLFDTGDFYGMGHNEMLVAEALKGGRRDKAILSVKFGALRGPAGGWSGADARPADRLYIDTWPKPAKMVRSRPFGTRQRFQESGVICELGDE
jgi:aryl-alcohol dehydrogenase-like predicted oxidoreductase